MKEKETDLDKMHVRINVGKRETEIPYRLYVLIQVTEPTDFFYNVTMRRSELYGRRSW